MEGGVRFIKELERLAAMDFAGVVVEATLETIMTAPPVRSRVNPRSIFASIIAWQQRFTRVHWYFAGSREVGEAITIRVLDRFWREQAARAELTGAGATGGAT